MISIREQCKLSLENVEAFEAESQSFTEPLHVDLAFTIRRAYRLFEESSKALLDEKLQDTEAANITKQLKSLLKLQLTAFLKKFGIDILSTVKFPETVSVFYKLCHFVGIRPYVAIQERRTVLVVVREGGMWEPGTEMLVKGIRQTPAGISIIFDSGSVVPYEIVIDTFGIKPGTEGVPQFKDFD